MEALAKHAMPFALKGTGVDSEDLTNLMLKMKSNTDPLAAASTTKQTMMLRRVHAPRKIKVIRRIKPVRKPLKTLKYPVYYKLLYSFFDFLLYFRIIRL